MKVFVLDTNVLLADPGALLGFPDAEVVIPETVLGELDKLKTSRVDPDLRFRGREVSRIMFDLSEQGSLIAGVSLPDGGSLRVAPVDPDAPLPEGFSTRNPDDKILAVAVQLTNKNGGDVVLVTNDLNMLLKAQTFGVAVERHGEGMEASFGRRYIVRPFQRYKIPLGILAVAVAVFAAIVVVAFWGPGSTRGTPTSVPPEFKELLSNEQKQALDNLLTLQVHANDESALRSMGDFYYDLRDQTANVRYALKAIGYYERYLKLQPNDPNVRTDLAVEYFYTGKTDKAITETARVIKDNPNHLQANYWLGIFNWQAERHDFQSAAAQMQHVIDLTENNPNEHAIYQQAALALEQIRKDAQAAGKPLPSAPSTPTEGLQ